MGQKKFSFSVADVGITLQSERPFTVTDPFLPFEKNSAPEDRIIDIRFSDALPACKGKPITETPDIAVYPAQSGFVTAYRDRESGTVYAAAESAENGTEITCLNGWERFFSETGNCFYHSGWEAMLARRGRLIMHAAAIESPVGGILFSGPSGIGKSTQAELWHQYENASLVNGDRTILYKKENCWMAAGSPYAGSSRCYRSVSVPVRAVVMLSQSPNCSIARLPAGTAFRRVLPMLTAAAWNRGQVSAVCDLAMALVEDIPVYALACTPDRNAVNCLLEELNENGN